MPSADRLSRIAPDWYDYDALAEQTSEPMPLPDYARPVRAVRHFEFEHPMEVM